MKQKVFLLLVILFSIHLGFRIFEYRQEYLTPYDPDFWKERYEYSQWSTKPACENLNPHVNPFTCVWDDHWYAKSEEGKKGNDFKKQSIGDDSLYTYAGWEYVHGHDPTLLNAEVPPFGKYLIGLAEVLFKNQNIFALLSGLFALGALYLFSVQIFKDRVLSFLPVLFFSLEPLFYTQLRAPFLDLLFVGLLLLTMTFLIKKQFIRSSIMLGLAAATKSAASTFPLVIALSVLYLILTKQFTLFKKYVISLPVAGVVFTLSYIQFFILGNSFIEFLGVQKWIINFYSSGAQGSFMAPWEILFTGKWHTWWGEYMYVSEWHLGWPLLVLFSLYALYKIIRERIKEPIVLCAIWIIIYFIFLSVVPTWPRYLLVVLPFMYNLAIWSLVKGKKHFKQKKKHV